MTTLPLFQVDAFTDRIFGGNPAAVCPLETWLGDDVLQAIASENNLSETAFFLPSANDGADMDLRWFTPAIEVDLCGHATLASAHVLFDHLDWSADVIRFATRSGVLSVSRSTDSYVMDLPNRQPVPGALSPALRDVFDIAPADYLQDRPGDGMNMAVFNDAQFVRNWTPRLDVIAGLEGDGLIITAPGDIDGVDCVSRYFAPNAGIPEDQVTGSAHCVIAPYWCARLDRDRVLAHQVSARGGELRCRVHGDRVDVAGAARTCIEGAFRYQ